MMIVCCVNDDKFIDDDDNGSDIEVEDEDSHDNVIYF